MPSHLLGIDLHTLPTRHGLQVHHAHGWQNEHFKSTLPIIGHLPNIFNRGGAE